MSRIKNRFFATAIGILAVLGILIAINVLFSHVRMRTDMTEEQIYSLSSGTVDMLKSLDRKVTLKFYFTKDNANVPIPLKNYAQRVNDFLSEIVANSDGNVILEDLNPEPDSEAEEWAQRYGLVPQSTGMMGMQPDLYLGLVAISGTKEAAIPFLAPTLEPQMEYLVVRLLHEVTQAGRTKIGIMSSLPVMAPPASPYAPPTEKNKDWFFVSELKKQYDVLPVDLQTEQIPEELDALIVIHPKGITEQTLFAVDQFVLKGGRLICFIDPLCFSAEKEQQDIMGMPDLSSDINRLSQAWGITMDTQNIVADLSAATPINLGNGAVERLATWLSLRGGQNINKDEIVTGSLESLMLPFAGMLSGTPAENLTQDILLSASSDGTTVNTFQARNPAAINTRNATKTPNAPLAMRLSGTFKTAFPEGKPTTTNDTETSTASTENWLKESQKESAVILISDADILANEFSVRAVNFFGQVIYQPMNDNLNLTLNLAEQLSGNEALIGLRSRGSFDRPFDKVLALEVEAQERWQEQEEKLQQRLQQTQQRINELQATKSEDQQLILSAEQKAEVEKFRRERFETQRQLKNVRKNLRKDIENLGMRLKVINMAAIPFFVALFGITFAWHRRRKTTV